jgi:hypothetical protein
MSVDVNANNPVIYFQSVLEPDDISGPNNSARPPQNAWSPDTSSAWEGVGVPSGPVFPYEEAIEFHNKNLVSIDYFAVAGTNFSEMLAAGVDITVDVSANAVNWSNIATITSDNNSAHVVEFAARSDEYFRINFFLSFAEEVPPPIISHVKLGNRLVLQRRNYDGYSPSLAPMVVRNSIVSDSGEYLGDIVTRKKRTQEIDQQNNTPEFVRTEIVPFINHVNGEPVENNTAPSTFFYAWRPGDYPDEVVYAWVRGNIQPVNQGGDSLGGMMAWSVSIEALA